LIVESAARGRSDSFYLQSALNLNDALPFNFAVKTAGAVDPAGVGDNGLVILNDSGPLPNGLAAAITKFVQTGGQLIISAGPHTDPSNLNQSLGDISPVTFSEAVQPRPNESVAITDIKFDHPIFEVFQDSGRLAAARVFGYLRTQPKPDAIVLARYEDGSPALVEGKAGKGRILLFTSSLGASWNDLPLTPLYLPLVHQMIRYIGNREAESWHGLGETFRVAKEPQGAAPAVDSPDGARLNENRLTPDGDLLVTGKQPGFYRLRYADRPDFAAVNLNANEGDFTKLDFGAFISGVTGGAGNAEGREANRNFSNEEIENRQRVWWPLLFVALLLLVSESLLAQRIKMAKMVG